MRPADLRAVLTLTREYRRDGRRPLVPGVADQEGAPRDGGDGGSGGHKASKFPSNFIKTSKYTIVTFIPLNLFHQFRKVSNFYFLVNMIFALIPGVSPIHPATAVLPLIFVIGVALAKDGYEDFQRHKNDNRANSMETHVLRRKDTRVSLAMAAQTRTRTAKRRVSRPARGGPTWCGCRGR